MSLAQAFDISYQHWVFGINMPTVMKYIVCLEIGQMLYHWFIDCLHLYGVRVTYAVIISKARYLRQRMLAAGYEPQAMPSLAGEAGKRWFRRWRMKFGIAYRKTGQPRKVSRKKMSRDRQPFWFSNVLADMRPVKGCEGYEPHKGLLGQCDRRRVATLVRAACSP